MRLTAVFMRLATVATGLFLATDPGIPARAQDSSTACLGQLMLFGGNYCPRGYTDADGKLLSVGQYSALFSLYGTMYGGNGQTTFGIPDLRGRAPISQGQGPGLPNYSQGELTGSPTATLTVQNLPAHSHTVNAVHGLTSNVNPGNQFPGTPTSAQIYAPGPANTQMAQGMIGMTGNNQPFSTQNPIQAIRWCVAVQGIYCSRQ